MAHEAEIHHDNHPGPKVYIIIAVILAGLTGLEVGAFFLELSSAVVVAILLLLSFAKFALVVAYFMHLKFDDKRFTSLFVAPFIAMVSIVVALLALFENLTR
jgi:cytochrome c oxidase subunit 4